MEDNDGYSLGARIDEIIKRKYIQINGKQFSIPRNLSDRIFGERSEELASSRLLYKDDGTFWAREVLKYRYRPKEIQKNVQKVVQDRLVSDYNEQFRQAGRTGLEEVDSSAVEQVINLEQSDLQNRKVFQSRLIRDFYKQSKF